MDKPQHENVELDVLLAITVSISDPAKSGRIQARRPLIDDNILDADLPWLARVNVALGSTYELPIVGNYVELFSDGDTYRWQQIDFVHKDLLAKLGEQYEKSSALICLAHTLAF